jgi:hypothetical protein
MDHPLVARFSAYANFLCSSDLTMAFKRPAIERNAVSKSSALGINRFLSQCASTQKRNPCFLSYAESQTPQCLRFCRIAPFACPATKPPHYRELEEVQ